MLVSLVSKAAERSRQRRDVYCVPTGNSVDEMIVNVAKSSFSGMVGVYSKQSGED